MAFTLFVNAIITANLSDLYTISLSGQFAVMTGQLMLING